VRFKVDETLPVEVAALLRDAGHAADTVQDEALAGAPDALVSTIVRAEQRALVTLDFDFADIRTYPPAEHAGILVLRPRTQDKETVMRLLARTLPVLSREPLARRLWIVEETRIRVRE